MKKCILLSIAFIIAVFSATQVLAATQTATINVDGNKSDWAAINPAVVDASGNSACGSTGDIKAVYTAMDSANVYFMVETYGTPINSTNTSVKVDFDFKPGQQLSWGFRGDIHISISSTGLSAWIDTNQDGTLEEFPIPGAVMSWGEVLEGSIPLSQLGNPAYFEPTFANTWNYNLLPQNHTSGCNPVTIRPGQGINFFYAQKRYYENGNTFNRLYIEMYDQNPNQLGDVLASAILVDPNGNPVEISTPHYTSGKLLLGSYDMNNGQWKFDPGFDYSDNSYSASFSGDLVPGDYRLQVITKGGWSDERTFRASQQVECPFIASSSFRAWKDTSGNLIWEWDPPYGMDPALRSRINALLGVEGNDFDFFWIGVPTHMGRLTIPKNTIKLLEDKGDKIRLQLFLRINNEFGNNFQRNASNNISLEQAMVLPPKGDVNNDRKIDLYEAIHALKVISGSNSPD